MPVVRVPGVSSFFEMLEWWGSLIGGSATEDFLATQGDKWDTQWDMFLAGVGAITSLLLLSRPHDQQLAALPQAASAAPAQQPTPAASVRG